MKIIPFLVNRYKLLGIILILLFIPSLFLIITDLKIDNSFKNWFIEGDPNYSGYIEFQEKYGSDDVVAVLLTFDKTVTDKEIIKKIIALQNALDTADYIQTVYSYLNSDYLYTQNGMLEVKSVVPEEDLSTLSQEEILKRFKDFPPISETMVSKDMKSLFVMAQLKPLEEIESKRNFIVREINETIKTHFPEFAMGGLAVLNEALNANVAKETSIFTSLSYLLLILLLAIYLKKRQYIYIALLAVVVPIVLMFGVFVLFGFKLNMISMILPVILMVYGVADVVHVINRYIYVSEENPEKSKKDLIIESLKYSWKPCLFASITTMAGYISLFMSPMRIIKETGLFAFVGVGIAFVATFMLASIGFMMFPEPRKEKERPLSKYFTNLNVKISDFFIRITLEYKYLIIAVFVLILIIGIYVIPHIEVNTYPIEYLSKYEKVRQDSRLMEHKMDAYLPFEMTLTNKDDEKLISPETLHAIDEFIEEVEKQQIIYHPGSIIDVIKYLNKKLSNDSSRYSIPETSSAIEQSLLIYEMDPENRLSELANRSYSELRITGRVQMLSSQDYASIFRKIDAIYREKMKDFPNIELNFEGYTPLYVIMIDYITESQLFSFSGAFIMALLAIFICFRNFFITLISIIPNIVPLSAVLIFMFLFDIPLDSGTAMIAAIMLGIAVDDTIHFLYSYTHYRKGNFSINNSIDESLRHTGKALLSTSITLSTGFVVISFSTVKSLHYFGLLCAVAVIFALLSDMLLLPALLKKKKVEQ